MDYFSFEKEFKRKLSQLKLPAGASWQAPLLKVTAPPLGWIVELFLRFADDTHVRIWEDYGKVAGLQLSRRRRWAYHYGPIMPHQIGSDGTLVKGACTDPLELRIDTTDGLHLHFRSQNPHYRQASIDGLTIESVDCWTFIRAVLKHRQSNKGLDEILGFKIKA